MDAVLAGGKASGNNGSGSTEAWPVALLVGGGLTVDTSTEAVEAVPPSVVTVMIDPGCLGRLLFGFVLACPALSPADSRYKVYTCPYKYVV